MILVTDQVFSQGKSVNQEVKKIWPEVTISEFSMAECVEMGFNIVVKLHSVIRYKI